MRHSNINQRILQRLLLVWLLLSVFIGGVVYYLEIAEIDKTVLTQVLQDSEVFGPSLMDKINSPEASVAETFQRKVDTLLDQHYSLVDVYDLNQAHVATAERELESRIRFVIEPRHHMFPLDKKLH